jgi:hypothetical protein
MLKIEDLSVALTALCFKAKGLRYGKTFCTAKTSVPALPEPKRWMPKVQALGQKIAKAHAVIAAAPVRQPAILQRYR